MPSQNRTQEGFQAIEMASPFDWSINDIGQPWPAILASKKIVLKTTLSKHKREVHEKNVVCHICNKEKILNNRINCNS